jgi:hypothetical protein
VFGNLLFVYTFLLGSARRGNHDLIKYGLLAPFYWLMMSWAAGKALGQLIGKPHYWEKTVHGLHLAKAGQHRPPAGSAAPAPAHHDRPLTVQLPRQRDRVGRHRLDDAGRAVRAAEPPVPRIPVTGSVHHGSLPRRPTARYQDRGAS